MKATDYSTNNSICTHHLQVWVVVPVRNNGGTVRSLAMQCLPYVDGVLIVDDGSTDADVRQLFTGTAVRVVTHPVNRGKGAALQTAIGFLRELGVDWMITMDGDGQHAPEDIPVFLQAIQEHSHSIIIGARDFSGASVPGSSRFGRRFSNMWIRLESGVSVSDTQSGFRAYPLSLIAQLPLRGNRYEFEVEVLTQAAWHGIGLVDVPVSVWYPDPEEFLVSSFRKWRDNIRISLVHARLCMRRLLPWPHRKLVKPAPDRMTPYFLLRHPVLSMKRVLTDNTSPGELGMAATVGSFLAVLPLVGVHTAAILYVAARLRLNLIMAVNIQHLYAPPVTPLACIVLGHYILRQSWITIPGSFRGAVSEVPHYLLFWLIGSLILAPLLSLLAGGAVYVLARAIKRDR